jgi:hypothetical protein
VLVSVANHDWPLATRLEHSVAVEPEPSGPSSTTLREGEPKSGAISWGTIVAPKT